jgi:hypothetical protein
MNTAGGVINELYFDFDPPFCNFIEWMSASNSSQLEL